MKRRSGPAALALALLASALTAAAAAEPAHAGPRPKLTDAEIARMAPAQQAQLLNPLREAASAVDQVGRTTESKVYAGVVIDAPSRSVHLYVTDTSQSAKLLREAHRVDPHADLSLVTTAAARYSRKTLHAARDRIAAHLRTLPVDVENAIVPADGSGLVLGVTDRRTAHALTRSAASAETPSVADVAGVAVKLVPGATLQGAVNRYSDISPFYSGDYLINSGWACTMGIPVKGADGTQYMVIASHCGHTGTVWKTGGGTTVGTVVLYDEYWDAALVKTGSARYEADGYVSDEPYATNVYQLNDTKYSYNGDYVCQNGYTSGFVCNIKVTDQDAQNFRVRGPRYGNTFSARGVIGSQVNGNCGIRDGDSGGLVFAINGSTTRQVRGIVSASVDGTNCHGIFWTEALDIYNRWSLYLTDRTY